MREAAFKASTKGKEEHNESWHISEEEDDIVSSYFVKISRIKYELQVITEVVPERELVIVALLGLPKYWSSFALGIRSWKHTPTFEQLWNAWNK